MIHSEIKWSQPKFSPLKKENKLKDKIGTIDFEIYFSSFDLGLHKVSAGGWAIEGKTKLFYKNKNETNEQFVNRLLTSIFMQKFLTGYTFYIHNLGRFDSIFIIKSLLLNDQISIK